jgi:hypothetical protein
MNVNNVLVNEASLENWASLFKRELWDMFVVHSSMQTSVCLSITTIFKRKRTNIFMSGDHSTNSGNCQSSEDSVNWRHLSSIDPVHAVHQCYESVS